MPAAEPTLAPPMGLVQHPHLLVKRRATFKDPLWELVEEFSMLRAFRLHKAEGEVGLRTLDVQERSYRAEEANSTPFTDRPTIETAPPCRLVRPLASSEAPMQRSDRALMRHVYRHQQVVMSTTPRRARPRICNRDTALAIEQARDIRRQHRPDREWSRRHSSCLQARQLSVIPRTVIMQSTQSATIAGPFTVHNRTLLSHIARIA